MSTKEGKWAKWPIFLLLYSSPLRYRRIDVVWRHGDCIALGQRREYNWVRGASFKRGEMLLRRRRTERGSGKLDSNEIARKIVEIASNRKAEDIVMLDISKVSIIADYFVICSGTGDRHVKAIAREIEEKLREEDAIRPINVEGITEGTWVLMDYGDVLVHVFAPETRDFYRLEQLWSGAQPVLVVQ